MTTAIRAFVALPLADDALGGCLAIQDELQSRSSRHDRTRWTRVEQMHVTVKFLGSVAAERIDDACQLVQETASGSSPFSCSMQRPDAFPTPRRARVIIIPLALVPGLDDLARTLEVGFSRLSVPQEKRTFSPHVTLGRLRRPEDVQSRIAGIEAPPVAVAFERLVLFRSDREPSGARYTPIVSVALGAGR